MLRWSFLLDNALQNIDQYKIILPDLDDKELPGALLLDYYNLNTHAAIIRNLYGKQIDHFNELANVFLQDGKTTEEEALDDLINEEIDASELAFEKLVEMKQSIVALVMFKYSQDKDPKWHPLLKEFIANTSGRQSPSGTFNDYEDWEKWFCTFSMS